MSEAIRYNDVISSAEDFSGEKFREVLASHGLTVIDTGHNSRRIVIAAQGEIPQRCINVPYGGHNLDKYVFNKLSDDYRALFENNGKSLPNISIDKRLQYLNHILLNSGYVGEAITLEMLNSNKPLKLSLGYLNIQKHENIRLDNNQPLKTGSHIATNKKEVEQVKGIKDIPLRDNESSQELSLKNNSKVMITAVIGGKTMNMSLTSQQQQKLMAVDDGHRLKMLDRMLPDAHFKNLSQQDKTALLASVNNQLFGKPSIFVASIEHTTQSCTEKSHNLNVADLSSANYENCLRQSQSQSENNTQTVSRGV